MSTIWRDTGLHTHPGLSLSPVTDSSVAPAGRLELREDTIESLLSASCLLQLPRVVQACCSFLVRQLHPSNCLGIRSYADAQGCSDLQSAAHSYTMVGTSLWSPQREELLMGSQ